MAGRWWQDGREGGGEVVERRWEVALKANEGVVGRYWEKP